jgi:ketosteroid isomerase-like protein
VTDIQSAAATDPRVNAQPAVEAFRALVAADLPAVERLFSADVRWHYPQSFARRAAKHRERPPTEEHDTVFEGRDMLLDVTGNVDSQIFRNPRPEIIHVAADGDLVVLLVRVRAELHNGTDYDNFYAFHMRFEEGQVAEVWELLDSAYAFSTGAWEILYEDANGG